MPSFRSEYKQIRAERILEAQPSRVLTSPWMRRLLSLVAVLSSYAMLATLLIPTPYFISKGNRIYADYDAMEGKWLYEFRDFTQGFALVLLVWSYILLRISMRRVTLLPNNYLDERQIANRDWAFKTGYLVVRRIGFGVALLFAFLATFGNQMTRFSAGYSTPAKAFRALERYLSDLSMEDPFGFYFRGFLLLAFVAYSFPIILLAWREAKFPEAVPEAQEVRALNPRETAAKFYFKAIKWLGLFIAVSASTFVSPDLFIRTGPFVYLILVLFIYVVLPGALVLFAWASITTAKGIRAAKKVGLATEQDKRRANIATAFLTSTLGLGLTVGTIMFLVIFEIASTEVAGMPPMTAYALLAGLLMAPAQSISMMFYAKLKTKEEQDK